MTKKQKKFKLLKEYRFLVGDAPLETCKLDLNQYNQHRLRCFKADPKVDCYPPKMNPRDHYNNKRLVSDALRLRQIDKENKELVKKINIINRTKGAIDSYNPMAYWRNQNWETHNKRMKLLEKHNKIFYERLCAIESNFSNKYLEESWQMILKIVRHSCKYPIVILKKKSKDEEIRKCPSISRNLDLGQPSERPLCFLEFKVDGGSVLGRIVLELYFDHVPVTVQNFLELCKGTTEHSYKKCLVHRIIKGDFMESGDITQGNGKGGISIYGQTFPEEKHVLGHTKAGVISMKRIGWAENNSQFLITFCKMDKMDHMNVVFGHTIIGNDVLFKISDYGRKIGKPLERIIISDCGEVNRDCIKRK